MIKNAIRYLESHETLLQVSVVALFFGLYLLLGLSVYKDYGISSDEGASFKRGQLNYQRFVGAISEKKFLNGCSGSMCYYPPAFEILLYGVAHTGSDQSIFQMRHLVTFLYFFIAVFFFFLLGKIIFKDWKLGLLGALFLVLSPRIFAHSFYNPKDLPFLSSYVIAMFTLLMYLKKKNILFAILHGLATGVACNIRTPGDVLIAITFGFLALDVLFSKSTWKSILKAMLTFSIFIITASLVIYFTFPTLYNNPIGNYIETFNKMKQFPWDNYQLYLGQNISNQIPWHYSIVWFGISSPVFYVVLFLLGLVLLSINTLRSKWAGIVALRDVHAAAVCGILPVVVVIALKSVIYTDNRQMYFCYPALLLISVYGFLLLVKFIQQKIASQTYQQIAVLAILVIGLFEPVGFMLTNHPNEFAYFNILAGPSMSVVKERFGLDTWHLSFYQGYKYIAATDSRDVIKIAYLYGKDPGTGQLNLHAPSEERIKILPAADARRLTFTTDDPDYIFEIYRTIPFAQVDLSQWQRYFFVRVGDTDIFTVYKRIRD